MYSIPKIMDTLAVSSWEEVVATSCDSKEGTGRVIIDK